MITIHIDNSECKIANMTREEHKALKDRLSFQDNPSAAYFSGGYPRKRCLLGKDGTYPTGLHSLVLDHLKAANIPKHLFDLRIAPKRLSKAPKALPEGVAPYPEQIAAVEVCRRYKRGTVVMPTGCGKSLTQALLIQALNVRTLVVVPNLGLKQQLEESFIQVLGSLDNVTVLNIDSPKLKTLTNFDCIIIDEAHHAAAKTYRSLNKKQWSGIFYRFFFTATPFRSRDEEQLLMESVCGQVIYQVDYTQARDAGYVVPVEAYCLTIPTTKTSGYTWAEVYSDLVTNNHMRTKLIANLLDTLNSCGHSTICLTKEIAHGKAILEAMETDGGRFISGMEEDNDQTLKDFNARRFYVLIGTDGVLGEGRDSRPCEYVILGGLGKAKNAFMQKVGRGLRRFPEKQSCKLILINDKSHKWTRAHFATQVKILKEEYGVKVVDLRDGK